ncbi:MAG: hypothetical protein KDM81_07650 [Verrucomicrobiae bacterium]|nr:hypothetical protein [Verrucomicrobiae bacterium]
MIQLPKHLDVPQPLLGRPAPPVFPIFALRLGERQRAQLRPVDDPDLLLLITHASWDIG